MGRGAVSREGQSPYPRGSAPLAAGGFGVVFGLGLGAVFFLAHDDPVDTTTRILSSTAFTCLALIPGVLAILGRRRPALFLAAGVVGVLLAFTSLAGVALPLLIPAVMSFVAYAHTSSSGNPAFVIFSALAAIALAVASFFVLTVMHEDPRCGETNEGTTCSSDVVTAAEAVASLGLTAAAIGTSWALARPKRDA